MFRGRLTICCVLAVLGQPDLAAGTDSSLAIWRLKPLGMDSPTAGRLEALLRAEAGRVEGVVLQDEEVTGRKLADRADLLSCGGETACLCEIGKALDVDKLVTGVIGELGDDYTFDLKLIDIAGCSEERRINEALSGREDLLISAIRQALYKLVAPRLFVGSMSVEVPVTGADVVVDGRSVGRTPLDRPISGLSPGVHRLRIAREGFSEFTEEVPVRFQQTTRVMVDLVKSVLTGLSYEEEHQPGQTPEPVQPPVVEAGPVEPPTSIMRILAWSSGGLTAATAAAAGILGWRSLVAEQEIEDAAHSSQPYLNASYNDTYERGRKLALAANICWALAGGAAVASAALFIIDLTGDDDHESESPPGPTSIVVAPGLAPDGGGLSVRFSF